MRYEAKSSSPKSYPVNSRDGEIEWQNVLMMELRAHAPDLDFEQIKMLTVHACARPAT
jgi:hypothetical protein